LRKVVFAGSFQIGNAFLKALITIPPRIVMCRKIIVCAAKKSILFWRACCQNKGERRDKDTEACKGAEVCFQACTMAFQRNINSITAKLFYFSLKHPSGFTILGEIAILS
jgi:hypothetical protein